VTPSLSIALFLFIATITPGPNNLVLMRAAARNGWTGALPALIGVVSGGLVLLVAVASGAGSAFSAWPWLRVSIELGGVVYLVWLGVQMFVSAGRDTAVTSLPTGLFGLFCFQFLNPKGWVMVLTVVAASNTTGAIDAFRRLTPLFVAIPTPCLLLWAGLGGVLARHLTSPMVRLWTDRLLGALLILAALLLFV